jgi:midasin
MGFLTSFSFQSLKDTFDHFTSMWINMKYRLKAKESDDSQYFKFKSRMISIDDIFKDVPLLSDMESEDSILDNEEKLEHEFFKITVLPSC